MQQSFYTIVIFSSFITISYAQNSKLLVATGVPSGYDQNGGQHSEVIDLTNLQLTCDSLQDFPIKVQDATGALLESKSMGAVPVICGGRQFGGSSDLNDKCYFLTGSGYQSIRMVYPDLPVTSSVSWKKEDTLWLSHGLKTEFVSFKSSVDVFVTPGPDLPKDFQNHCMTKINETHNIVIGNAGNTLLVNVQEFAFVEGPKVKGLQSDNIDLGCGVFEHNGRPHVAVGEVYYHGSPWPTRHVLIWDTANDDWTFDIEAPYYEKECIFAKMVTSSDGQGLIIFYDCWVEMGSMAFNKLLELRSLDDNLTWIDLAPHNLKHGHFRSVSMTIPDELTDCV